MIILAVGMEKEYHSFEGNDTWHFAEPIMYSIGALNPEMSLIEAGKNGLRVFFENGVFIMRFYRTTGITSP